MKLLFRIIFASLILLPACEAPRDEIGPDLDIIEPDEFSNHQVGESVSVEVAVSDDQQLDFVRIDIVNQSQNRVAGPVQYSDFNSISDQRTVSVNLNDVNINSGAYFIRVTASDGENERTRFREINLIEVPREVLSILAFHEIGPNEFGVDSLDRESNVFVDMTSFSPALEKFAKAGTKELAFFSSSGGNMQMVQNDDLESIANYSFPTGGTGPEFWRGVSGGESVVFASASDGQIRSWSDNGTPGIGVQVAFGFQADQLLATDDFLYVELHPINQGQSQLAVHHMVSGAFFQSAVIENDIIEMLDLGNGELMIFQQDQALEAEVYKYSTSANGSSATLNLNYTDIRDAERSATGSFYVADETGIHKFQLQNGSTLVNNGLLRSGDYAQLLADPVSGGIYAFESSLNELQLLDPFDLTLVASYSLAPGTQGFALFYNR